MHAFQSKHTKLKQEEVEKLLKKFNLSLSQLPKISKKDSALPEDTEIGEVFRIDRKTEEGNEEFFRVVV